jgi:hypothetical protein
MSTLCSKTSPDVNNSYGKNDQMVNVSSGKNDQLAIISCGKNDQMVHISCGRIDPNSNISEAWIVDLKNGRCIAWDAESSKTGTGACLEQVVVWSRMRHVTTTLFFTPKSKNQNASIPISPLCHPVRQAARAKPVPTRPPTGEQVPQGNRR